MAANINNFDLQGTTYTLVGTLTEVGTYAGEYEQLAYELLEIVGELEGEEWCDICTNEKGEIYAVYGNTTADSVGTFFYKCLCDGIVADSYTIECIGRCIAKYNVCYPGTKTVNYSIEWFQLNNGSIFIYNHQEGDEAYLSSQDELDEAREALSGGYWAK